MKDDKELFAGDVVAIVVEVEDKPAAFIAHILDIRPDKKGWWCVSFRSLIDGTEWFWLLDDDHIRQEEFTIGGNKRQVVLFSRIGLVEKEEKKAVVEDVVKNPTEIKELF